MKILIMDTISPTLRSNIVAWDIEDSGLYVSNEPIGLTPSPNANKYAYDTILEAIAEGWELMGPPVKIGKNYYTWWLKK